MLAGLALNRRQSLSVITACTPRKNSNILYRTKPFAVNILISISIFFVVSVNKLHSFDVSIATQVSHPQVRLDAGTEFNLEHSAL